MSKSSGANFLDTLMILDKDMEQSHLLKKTDNCTMWQVHDRFAGMEYVECGDSLTMATIS